MEALPVDSIPELLGLYDGAGLLNHVTGERFRHGARLLPWRPDKAPAQCTMDQLEQSRADLLTLPR